MNAHADRVVQHLPSLRRYARALVRDRDRAEDLVQETLARALSKLSFWRSGSDMRAWLFTVMRNQFVNDCRRANNTPAIAEFDAGYPEPVAAARAETDAELDDIKAALMSLPYEQRAVLLLVSLEGLSYAETAKVLEIKVGTVMSRLHRGRERMRQWLHGQSPRNVEPIRRIRS